FVAPGIARGGGDVADGAEMRAGRGLALHRHGEAGDDLEDWVLVPAVLPGADRAALVSDQRSYGRYRAHHRSEDARDQLLLGKHHRGVAERARGVAGADAAETVGHLLEVGPEEPHVAHTQNAHGE